MARRKQILIVTDDSGESYAILYAKHRFEEAGWTVHIGASKKKRLHGVIHDFEPGWNTYIERPGYNKLLLFSTKINNDILGMACRCTSGLSSRAD